LPRVKRGYMSVVSISAVGEHRHLTGEEETP
jgi:hypothetical protein